MMYPFKSNYATGGGTSKFADLHGLCLSCQRCGHAACVPFAVIRYLTFRTVNNGHFLHSRSKSKDKYIIYSQPSLPRTFTTSDPSLPQTEALATALLYVTLYLDLCPRIICFLLLCIFQIGGSEG